MNDEVGNRTEKRRTKTSVTTKTANAYNGANQLIKVDSQDYQFSGFSVEKGIAYALGRAFKVEKRYANKYIY